MSYFINPRVYYIYSLTWGSKMEKARYSALDVARLVVNISNDNGYSISNLKLQKILYFIQRAFLVVFDIPCFTDDIEAWEYGPVVTSVYQEFKVYGSNCIPRITTYRFINFEKLSVETKNFDDGIFADKDKILVKNIIEIYKDISPVAMIKLTHNQSPWIEAFKSGTNMIISNIAIKKSYQGLDCAK